MGLIFKHSMFPQNKNWPTISVFDQGEAGFYAQIEADGVKNFCYKSEGRGTALGALCELLSDEYDGKLDLFGELFNWLRVVTEAIRSYQKD